MVPLTHKASPWHHASLRFATRKVTVGDLPGIDPSSTRRSNCQVSRAVHHFLRPLAGADRFLRLTGALGVVDVREAGSSGSVFVFLAPGTDDEKLDGARILAAREWPDREVIMAKRS